MPAVVAAVQPPSYPAHRLSPRVQKTVQFCSEPRAKSQHHADEPESRKNVRGEFVYARPFQ